MKVEQIKIGHTSGNLEVKRIGSTQLRILMCPRAAVQSKDVNRNALYRNPCSSLCALFGEHSIVTENNKTIEVLSICEGQEFVVETENEKD